MSDREKLKQALKIMYERGIEIDISGCGCCDSPVVHLKIDGEPILLGQPNCNIDNYSGDICIDE
jgi:hypothetical protein